MEQNKNCICIFFSKVILLIGYSAVLFVFSRLYPYQSFLPAEGIQSVLDTLNTFQVNDGSNRAQGLAVESVQASSERPGLAKVSEVATVDGKNTFIKINFDKQI